MTLISKDDWDLAALDRTNPWLPVAPVADTEASETRGGPDCELTEVESTLNQRGNNYGDFEDNACIAQSIKLAMQFAPRWQGLEDDMKEALDLIATKIGRMLSGDPNYVDNWHDIAGYATLIEQRLNKRSK